MTAHHFVRTVVVLVVFGALVLAAQLLTNPLLRSNDGIRGWLLKQAPLGSKFEDVKALTVKKKWSARDGWGGEQYRPVKGIHWLQADLGEYRFFFWPWHAHAMWGFDQEKLVDVRAENWGEK